MNNLNNLRFKYDLRKATVQKKILNMFDNGMPFHDLENNIKVLKDKLSFTFNILTYLLPSDDKLFGKFNALVTKNNKNILIGITSDMYDILDANEMNFVLGHEIGHIIFGHLNKEKNVQSIESFYQEISADRIGYLVCRDIGIITNVLYKIRSGFISKYKKNSIKETLNHKESIKSHSHPSDSIRIKSLIKFSMSKKYKDYIEDSNYVYDNDDLENSINKELIEYFKK